MGIKEQKHQLLYTLVYEQRGCGTNETKIFARLLTDALYTFCKICIDEDETGIFFELENANVEELSKSVRFHKVTVNGVEYGIILKDVKIETPYRNKYLCELRAKRELIGMNIEEFARECGANPGSYKEKEEGHRSMKLEEYATYMKIAELYLD